MGKIKTNLLYNVAYQILILIVPLITTPYVSRVLLPEGVGIYALTTAIAKYFWMFALLGMTTYGNRSIAKVKYDKNKLSVTFWNLYYFQVIISSICLIVYIGYALTVGYTQYGIVVMCQIPYVMSALFEVSWFYYGTEQFKFMVTRNVVIKTITAASVFIFVNSPDDVWIYVLINALNLFVGQLCLWLFLWRHIHFAKPQWKLIRSHLKPNCVLFVSVVAVSVYTLMDKIMIEALSTTTELGYYENSYKIMDICCSIVGAIGAVMLPRISYLMENNDNEKVSSYLEKSMRYIMMLAVGITFGMAGVGKEFSIIYFGEKFARCGVLMMAMAPTILFYSWENILRTQYLLPGNKDRIFVMATVYAAVANLVLNALLIRRLGALGASFGTVGALFVATGYQTLRVRKELPILRYIQELIPFCVIGLIMFVYCRWIGNLLSLEIITIILQVLGGGLIYCIGSIVYLIVRKDAMVMQVAMTIRDKIRKRECA